MKQSDKATTRQGKTNKKIHLFSLFLAAFLTGGAFFSAGINYGKYYQSRQQIRQEIVVWKKKAAATPLYPDSWVKLALLWQASGKTDWAKLAIAKAQKLDPIRKDIQEISEEIKKLGN
jgi:hypothetical protein